MGVSILAVTALLVFVYFPEQGGMLFKAGSLPYDPQIIKPPAGYRGADSMNYGAATTPEATTTPKAAEAVTDQSAEGLHPNTSTV